MQSTYYLVKFDSFDVEKDFESVLGHLKSYSGLFIEQIDDTSAQIQIDGAAEAFDFRVAKRADASLQDTGTVFEVTCPSVDLGAVDLMRYAGAELGYRMFSVDKGTFLPEEQSLMPFNTGLIKEKATNIFKQYGLVPVFVYRGETRYYAQDEQGKIHIINPALLDFYMTYGIDTSDSQEFSYVVAEDISRFVAMHDQGIVPVHFYDYYRKNMDIFNYSGMEIWKVSRKIFIKPYLFNYRPDRAEYELLTSDKAVLNFADKIRKGENLKTAVERVLTEEFKIQEPFHKIRVSRSVEFDRDRNEYLTPRLSVGIFFEKLELKPEVEQQTKREWSSLDKVVN